MNIKKQNSIKKSDTTPLTDSKLDEMVKSLLFSRKERLSCVAIFSTFSILFLQGFHMFFLWRYAAAGVEQHPQPRIFFYILGIVLLLIVYGIFAACRESVSPWVVFSISILILILPVIAIGAEAYHFFIFYETLHSAATQL